MLQPFNPAGFDYRNFTLDKLLVQDVRKFEGKNEVLRYLLEDGSTVLQTKDLKGRQVVGLVVGERQWKTDGLNPDSGWGEKADIVNRYLFGNGNQLREAAADRPSQQIFKLNCVLINQRLAESLAKHDVPKIKDKKILASLGEALKMSADASADQIRSLATETLKKGGPDAQIVLGAINAQYVQNSNLDEADKNKARMLLIANKMPIALQYGFLEELVAKAPALRQAFVHFVDTGKVDDYFKARASVVVERQLSGVRAPLLPPRQAQNSCAAFEGLVKSITVHEASKEVVDTNTDKLMGQLETFVTITNETYEATKAPTEDQKSISEEQLALLAKQHAASVKKLDELKAFVGGLVANPKLTALNGNEKVAALLAYAQGLVDWLSQPY